jgi:hypothetical protein
MASGVSTGGDVAGLGEPLSGFDQALGDLTQVGPSEAATSDVPSAGRRLGQAYAPASSGWAQRRLRNRAKPRSALYQVAPFSTAMAA